MAGLPKLVVVAELRTIKVEEIKFSHKLKKHKKHPKPERGWPYPPILVIDKGADFKARYYPLDGNHRVNLCRRLGRKTIQAWCINYDELEPILDLYFKSQVPGDFYLLDKYIYCDNVSYAALRLRSKCITPR